MIYDFVEACWEGIKAPDKHELNGGYFFNIYGMNIHSDILWNYTT